MSRKETKHRPPRERVLELLDVDVERGTLIRRMPVRGYAAGTIAGTAISQNGYHRVGIDQQDFYVHQVIWLVATGNWPKFELDHKNGCRTDNRIANLREVTRIHNSQNRKVARAGSKSGLIGATWNRRRRKWKSEISVDGRRVHLGSFASADEAHAAYLKAKANLHEGYAP